MSGFGTCRYWKCSHNGEEVYTSLTIGSNVAHPYRNSIIKHCEQLGHTEFQELNKSAVSDSGHMWGGITAWMEIEKVFTSGWYGEGIWKEGIIYARVCNLPFWIQEDISLVEEGD